jgi:hypothetical protein
VKEADACKPPGDIGALQFESEAPPLRRPTSARALTAEERRFVLDVLHEPRFVDLTPVRRFLSYEQTEQDSGSRESKRARLADTRLVNRSPGRLHE